MSQRLPGRATSLLGRAGALALAVALALLVVTGTGRLAGRLAAPPVPADTASVDPVPCMDRYAEMLRPQQDKDVALLSNLYQLCYGVLRSRLVAQEQVIRNETLVFQRSENVVIMWMVVAITLSGVALAGAQLLASYRLADRGRGTIADGGEVNLAHDHLAVRSSYVGVLILAISFAFFLVFVIYVYTLREIGGADADADARGGQAAAASGPPAQTPPFQTPAGGNIGLGQPRQPTGGAVPRPGAAE